MPVVVPLYASVLAVMCIALAVRVIGARRTHRVAIGHGGHAPLERAMRVHANFCEYAPLALVVLLLAELQGWPVVVMHLLCGAFLLGRLLHAVGVSRTDEDLRLRQSGMALTFTVLGCAAALLLYGSLTG
jgi:uncharacterized protein